MSAAALALFASFLLIVLFARSSPRPAAPVQRLCQSIRGSGPDRNIRPETALPGLASLLALFICIWVGLFGTRDANRNINMTAFWVVFWLGFQYAHAVFGNFFSGINPWHILASLLELGNRWRFKAPKSLALLPFLFFFCLVWAELLGDVTPLGLSWMLIAYTCINLVGAWMFGRDMWFFEAEFFNRFFGNIASTFRLMVNSFRREGYYDDSHTLAPTAGFTLLTAFFLSSTAFDGLRDTAAFVGWYWFDLYRLLVPWIGDDITKSFALLQKGFHLLQVVILAVSPAPFLLTMLLAGWIARALTKSTLTSWELAKFFAPSVLPVALGYSVAHYFTLIPSQGFQLFRLISDPLGRGWNLWGTATWNLQVLLPVGIVWHIEVAAIVVGHILGVYCGHLIALRLFGSPRRAMLSQLPMLVAMMLFTLVGLWILGQPLTSMSAIVR